MRDEPIDEPPVLTWRAGCAADSLAAAVVNVRSWRDSFPQRQADGDDLSVVRRAAMFRRRFDTPSYRMVVAEAAGHGVVGVVDVGAARDSAWRCDAELYALYVLKRWQRGGVGRRLFELACDAVCAQGWTSMYLIALQDSPYRAFYERVGGRVLAQRAAGEVPGQDAHLIYGWLDLPRMR